MFAYLGRRGALGRFTLELAQAAETMAGIVPYFVLSQNNERITDFSWIGESLLALETFDSPVSLALVRKFFAGRRQLMRKIREENVETFVTLMPHV